MATTALQDTTLSGMRGTKRAAEPDPSSSSSKSRSPDDTGGGDSDSERGGGGGGGAAVGSLADIEETVQGAVTLLQGAFDFLDGPADVLSAATACRRWCELARADLVWRARFEREGLAQKARLFEVALPVAVKGTGAAGGGGSSSSAAAEEAEDALAGVGLEFYVQVFALKGYTTRDADYHGAEDLLAHPAQDDSIRTAVRRWVADPAAAKAKYGPIASWDTSEVTIMSMLFYGRNHFNEDISRWDVGQVNSMAYVFYRATSFNGDLSSWEVGQVRFMRSMFNGATSFDRQLDQAWAISTAEEHLMFGRCPGTIVGRTKLANGTIE